MGFLNVVDSARQRQQSGQAGVLRLMIVEGQRPATKYCNSSYAGSDYVTCYLISHYISYIIYKGLRGHSPILELTTGALRVFDSGYCGRQGVSGLLDTVGCGGVWGSYPKPETLNRQHLSWNL